MRPISPLFAFHRAEILPVLRISSMFLVTLIMPIKSKTENPIVQYMSVMNVSGLKSIGDIIEETPRTAPMLNVFEPMTLPIVIPTSFLITEMIEAVSSGRLVPIATIVTDMTFSEIPRLLAMTDAPSTIWSEPKASPASEAMRMITFSHIFF